MTRKLAVLGVDGLDPVVVGRHLNVLPNFAAAAKRGDVNGLESVFPPDSIPAWTTIFTGIPPGEHGILESVDYLSAGGGASVDAASALFRGRTFWDRLSDAGVSVCVVNPFMAFPAWSVRGAMVSGPVFANGGGPSSMPEGLAGDADLPQLGGIVDFPTPRTVDEFARTALTDTRLQAEYGLRVSGAVGADFTFVNILTVDRLQHFLWRFYDPADPTYPGDTPRSRYVPDAYRVVDEMIGRYLRLVGDDGLVVVCSDHGHGMRPTQMVYVDEILRRANLVRGPRGATRVRAIATEAVKRRGLSAAYRLHSEHVFYNIARRLPGRRAIKSATYATDSRSDVSVARTFGRNGVGGVWVRPRDSSSTGLVEAVCDALAAYTNPADGGRVVEWARPKAEVISVDSSNVYPEVLFQLRDGYGVDFGMYGPIVAPDYLHRRLSGGHRRTGLVATFGELDIAPPPTIEGLFDFFWSIATVETL